LMCFFVVEWIVLSALGGMSTDRFFLRYFIFTFRNFLRNYKVVVYRRVVYQKILQSIQWMS